MRKIITVLALALIPSFAWGQTAEQIVSCNQVVQNFEIVGNSPWGYTFTMAQLVPASDTDPTLVPQVYNGFTMQIDTFSEQDMGMGEVLGICPNGTQRAGDKIYKIIVQNVKLDKGNHILHLWAWNLDDNGQKRGGDVVNVPFVAVEVIPPFNRRPYAPINVFIFKGSNPPVQAPTTAKAPIKK